MWNVASLKQNKNKKQQKKIKGEFLTKFSAKTRAGKEKMGRKWGRGTEPGLILPNVTNSWFLAGSEVWVTVPRAKPLNLPLTTKEETSAGHHLCRYCPISHMDPFREWLCVESRVQRKRQAHLEA